MAVTSLTSARDYFEEVLKPAYNDFFASPSSFKNAYAMTNSLYHFHEWIWFYQEAALTQKFAITKKSDLWHQVVEQQVPDAGLIRDLNNVSKHVELKIGSNPSTQMHHSANTHIVSTGYGVGGYGVGRYGGNNVQLDEGGRNVSLDVVATALFGFWHVLIDEVEPLPTITVSATNTANS